MKPQHLEKMGEDRWSAVEDTPGPRYPALVLIVLLLAYGVVGMLESLR
jgi:hypothetical protein